MKVAVLLYGHLRDYKNCMPNLYNNLLRNYDCDVFIHTWDQLNHESKSWYGTNDSNMSQDIKPDLDYIRKTISPVDMIVEHQEPLNDITTIESSDGGFSFSSDIPYFIFYSMKKANELRKKYEISASLTYDLVIVTRPDINLLKKLDIDFYVNQARIINIFDNNHRFFGGKNTDSSYVAAFGINVPNDLLFFAKPEVVDKYIDAGASIDVDFMRSHYVNVVSIFTAKEIEYGIVPVPISFVQDIDFNFFRTRQNEMKEKGKKYKFFSIIFKPIISYIKKHPSLIK